MSVCQGVGRRWASTLASVESKARHGLMAKHGQVSARRKRVRARGEIAYLFVVLVEELSLLLARLQGRKSLGSSGVCLVVSGGR